MKDKFNRVSLKELRENDKVMIPNISTRSMEEAIVLEDCQFKKGVWSAKVKFLTTGMIDYLDAPDSGLQYLQIYK